MSVEFSLNEPVDKVSVVIPVDGEDNPIINDITPVKLYSGDKRNYRIEYGNGVYEIGGIVDIPCSTVASRHIEGHATVNLPFTNVLDWHAVAINVAEAPDTLRGEGCFTAVSDNVLKLYAHATSTRSATIPVKWMVKGV